jgi:hypothetical protein
MTTDHLEKITINLPGAPAGFNRRLVSLLETFGARSSNGLDLTKSDQRFYPQLAIDFQSPRSAVSVDFLLSNGEAVPIVVENTTGVEKKSPHAYAHLEIDSVAERLAAAELEISGVDHLGVNLPWFATGLHPRILQLRETIKRECLYHCYPTGEPWDFILPGTLDEIAGRQTVDYGKVRRPKFELVSFGKASTPLIQIDLGVNGRYEEFKTLFPEALADDAFRNIWIYLKNPYAIDICLVINEYSEGDWSEFFKGRRF